MDGKRLMRWGDGEMKFSRPIRWLLTLLDDTVLEIELVNGSETINSSNISWGHRVLHPDATSVTHANQYVETLRKAYVIVDVEERKHIIKQQVEETGKSLSGNLQIYPDLLTEVNNLVEYPSAVVGKFESMFLNLPTEVITTVMVSHQRYFPVFRDKECKELLPNFITISNGDPAAADMISVGNQRVVRARLADGQFFYNSDLAQPLENFLPKLETVTFQEKLGSLRTKVDRICENADKIAKQLKISSSELEYIQRAALLCKADLVTQMVYEFPELQGIMGQKYATANKEPQEVATAIFEHYLPRGADDILPQTITGQIVGLADRLDTLVSIFGLGMIPTGSSDPFALRRAAIAVINIIWSANLPVNLQKLIENISHNFATNHEKIDSQQLAASLSEFFLQRIRILLQEEKNIDYDLVNAVLGENDPEYTQRALQNLLDVRDRAVFLQQIRQDGTLEKIYETVNRSTRLAAQGDLDTRQLDPSKLINQELFQKSSESSFYQGVVDLLPQTQSAKESRNYRQLVTALEEISPTISKFFDGEDSVLVMDPDPDIKRNRLYLLGLLRNHARVLADFGEIVKNL